MKKKLLMTTAAAVLSLGVLAACGDAEETPTEDPAVEAPADVEVETDAPADVEEEVEADAEAELEAETDAEAPAEEEAK